MLPVIEQSQAVGRVSLPKRALCVLLTVALAATMTVLPTAQPKAYADQTKTVTWGQTQARNMLTLVNQFRASNPPCWNSNNTVNEVYSGLKPLQYDYTLEQRAMLRAAELTVEFDHLRPNGSWYYTVHSDLPLNFYAENIAYGQNMNNTFVTWREDNEKYAGQGHRRNMAGKNYTAIGIGHVTCNGREYWVQTLGTPRTINTTPTVAKDNTESIVINTNASKNVTQLPNPPAVQSSTSTSTSTSTTTSKPTTTTSATASSAKPAKVTLKKVTGKKRSVVVQWKKQTKNVTGFQIMIATDKKFKKNKATFTRSGKSKTSLTIKGLKAKKTYYVKVRAYKNVKQGKKTVKKYGTWSKVLSAKTKK